MLASLEHAQTLPAAVTLHLTDPTTINPDENEADIGLQQWLYHNGWSCTWIAIERLYTNYTALDSFLQARKRKKIETAVEKALGIPRIIPFDACIQYTDAEAQTMNYSGMPCAALQRSSGGQKPKKLRHWLRGRALSSLARTNPRRLRRKGRLWRRIPRLSSCC